MRITVHNITLWLQSHQSKHPDDLFSEWRKNDLGYICSGYVVSFYFQEYSLSELIVYCTITLYSLTILKFDNLNMSIMKQFCEMLKKKQTPSVLVF